MHAQKVVGFSFWSIDKILHKNILMATAGPQKKEPPSERAQVKK